MRVVDIWTDDADVPHRVRMIEDGPDGRWVEWRRLDDRCGWPTRSPGPVRRSIRSPARDWIGAESWTPSRPAPLLVSFDDDGNPYDAAPWLDDEELSTVASGAITGADRCLVDW